MIAGDKPMRGWGFHVAAAVLCAAVLVTGTRATADLDWPYDTDQFRDIAQAQAIRDGGWLQDPFYAGETVWYNPLLPATLAAISFATGAPVHIVAARAGAYLGLAAPIAFYVLTVMLAGPAAALAALVGFLFVAQGPTWLTPTYTPWLFGSLFAQPFFYATIALTLAAFSSGRAGRFAVAGVLLGLTFLAHTAPAVIAVLVIAVLAFANGMSGRSTMGQMARHLALVAIPALVVAAPFLYSILIRYHLHVVNPVPLLWYEPSLPREWWVFLRQLASRPLIDAMLLLGLAAAALGRFTRGAVPAIGAWLGCALALFFYANYAVPALRRGGIELPGLVSAHHFLVYERAAEFVLFGSGVAALAAAGGWLASGVAPQRARARAAAGGVTYAAALIAVVAASYPAFLQRDDYVQNRRVAERQFLAPEFRAIQPWIRSNTAPADVFLTAEAAGLSIVGPAGRKSVIVPNFFSNPYVHWLPRKTAERNMWRALENDDCMTFRAYARAYGVRYVLTAAGRTPNIQPGRCGLVETSFPGKDLRVLRYPRQEWQKSYHDQ